MKNLFDTYTPQPEEKKIRIFTHMPEVATGEITRKMKLSLPKEADVSFQKKQQEIKTDIIEEKSNQRVRRGEETTLF